CRGRSTTWCRRSSLPRSRPDARDHDDRRGTRPGTGAGARATSRPRAGRHGHRPGVAGRVRGGLALPRLPLRGPRGRAGGARRPARDTRARRARGRRRPRRRRRHGRGRGGRPRPAHRHRDTRRCRPGRRRGGPPGGHPQPARRPRSPRAHRRRLAGRRPGAGAHPTAGPTAVALYAVVGALAAGAVVVGAGRLGADSGTGLVLAGAAVTAGCTAITSSLVIALPGVLDRYRFWGLGSVARSGAPEIVSALPFIVLGLVMVLAGAAALDALALGDDLARGLGVGPVAGRGVVLAGVVLLSGLATALAGPIAFLGLLVPHLLRRLV